MKEKFFRVSQDVEIPNRWYLDDPQSQDGEKEFPWQFTKGVYLERPKELTIPLLRPGMPLDYSEPSFGMPVVSHRLGSIFQRISAEEIQLIPVRIESFGEYFFILNALTIKECVDEEHSKFKKFLENDPVRPDLAGQYNVIESLVINRNAVGSSKIFRIKHSECDLVLHEDIVGEIYKYKMLGARFVQVFPARYS